VPDPLLGAIKGAIGQRVDAMLFEECAVDLLRQQFYANLRGTPVKQDAGIDGIAGPDADPEFVLVVTTARDFSRNLRNSVSRYLDAGGSCRVVVLATTQEVTGNRRLGLQEELSRRWGVQIRAVHDRGDFVRLLYDDPGWRKNLLGVAGATRALSPFPANARPTPAIALIGRAAAVNALRQAEGDLVVVGKPGVGKFLKVRPMRCLHVALRPLPYCD